MRKQVLGEAGEVLNPFTAPLSTLPGLIRELQDEMRRSPRRAHLHEIARRRIEAPHEVIDWAKRDRRWSFTLAEIMNEPVAMPRELAARLLVAIVDELEQEREAFGDDGDGNSEIARAVQVD